MKEMQVAIITGVSGAGKTLAMRFLEDEGYFCVDNLPPALIPKFVDLCAESRRIDKIALVIDVRGGEFFDALDDSLRYLCENQYSHKILFLDASDEVLIRRFKETRRRHPLAAGGRLTEVLAAERERLVAIRSRADQTLDTSELTPAQFREKVLALFTEKGEPDNLSISIVSFGFKHGVPLDADLVFDVRFLPNPHYNPELRPLTGTDASVQKYIWREEVTHVFAEKLLDLLEFLLPLYKAEGKTQLVIAIGCTGGKHRSVAIACHLAEVLSGHNYQVSLEHRDIVITKVKE